MNVPLKGAVGGRMGVPPGPSSEYVPRVNEAPPVALPDALADNIPIE